MRKSALKTINADIYEIESRILELLAKVGSDKADPPTITTFRVLGLNENDKAQIEQCALSSLEQFKLLSKIVSEKLEETTND